MSWLIEQLKLEVGSVYGLPDMNKPRGEIRFAHHGPQTKKARGVFARIWPSRAGAMLVRNRKTSEVGTRTLITSENVAEILKGN